MSPRLIGPAASVLTVLLLVPVQVFPKLPLLLAERFYTGAGWAQIMAMSIYAGLLAGRMADPMTARRLRPRIWLLFSLVFFLQLFLGLAGIEKLLMTGKLHLPVPALIVAGPIYRGSDFFMPILFTITALLVGTAWCSHLCYIGAWDDFCSRGRKEPAQLPGRWSRVRHGILFLVVAVAILLRHFAVGRQTALMLAAVFGLAGVGVMLAASRRLGLMAHCTAFCPVGLVGNWLGRLSPWRMRIDAGCTACMQCRRVCRYSALERDNILKRQVGWSCTLCGDCVSACHSGQIGYSLPLLGKDRARAVFIVLITSLHAVFLAVARI